MTEERKNLKNVDIPDMAKREAPMVELPTEVRLERDIRRFIRKDGVFCKGFEHFFDRCTNPDTKDGRFKYEMTKTVEEATEYITELCTKTGRKVVKDDLTGRPKAVPGWNLNIHVPGMDQAEQNAHVEDERVVRERMLNMQLTTLQKQNADLMSRLEAIEKNQTAVVEAPEPSEPAEPVEDKTKPNKKK